MIHSGSVIAAGISQGRSTSLKRDFKVSPLSAQGHTPGRARLPCSLLASASGPWGVWSLSAPCRGVCVETACNSGKCPQKCSPESSETSRVWAGPSCTDRSVWSLLEWAVFSGHQWAKRLPETLLCSPASRPRG